ncbi:MAG: hypothetical protein IKS55_00885 [Oscillospiraceae bacterium]|nr:hypothetical protein [Oscillospiraceae bacterium]
MQSDEKQPQPKLYKIVRKSGKTDEKQIVLSNWYSISCQIAKICIVHANKNCFLCGQLLIFYSKGGIILSKSLIDFGQKSKTKKEVESYA